VRDAKSEMEGLWTAVFGEPPAVDAEPTLLAQLILRCSGPPPAYGMVALPYSLPRTEESRIVDECLLSGTKRAFGLRSG
jgi:hypothetical protein